MMNFPILSILMLLPIIGAIVIAFVKTKHDESDVFVSKNLAIFFSGINFLISLILIKNFNHTSTYFQFVEKYPLVKSGYINFHLGVDGISVLLIILTTLLIPICIASSYESIKHRVKEFLIYFLILESAIIGVFSCLDLVVFYVFFETTLIPMFLIIGIYGGANRIYASYKFFLYTLFGSLFMLVAIIYIYINAGQQVESMSYDKLLIAVPKFTENIQMLLFVGFALSFAVKIPMFPVHTWLPDAHVQAPTAGSVILAGILLKMGAYGFLRFSLPLMPLASIKAAPFIFALSIIAVIYASLVAFAQKDMKKLIAYSSIAHMGYVTIGIFSFNYQAMQGALIQMVSHGLVSGALFLCVGVLYDRMHTKEISAYGGVTSVMPRFAFVFMVFTMASVGLPGTSGFVGEFLVLLGSFQVNHMVGILTSTGIVLGAAYMLWLYKDVMFGEIKNEEVRGLKDLTLRESIILHTLAILVIVLGIYPACLTHISSHSMHNIIKLVDEYK